MPKRVTPLVPVHIPSIYHGPLPTRMASCTPDMTVALSGVASDLQSLGFELRLSDLFRSHDMQKQANADFVQGRKKAFSPPPGGSMHEAGRAMDIDLSVIGVPLARFWEISKARGFAPIIDAPIASRSEAWHFDCRGSHAAIYDYVRSGRAGASLSPYTQMAMSAILAIGVNLDTIPNQDVAFVQAALIRLGFDPGRIDGVIGDRTRGALSEAGAPEDSAAEALSVKLQEKFPGEFPS